jgi:hypothetical protein
MRIGAALLIYLIATSASQACSPGPVLAWDGEAHAASERLRRVPPPPRLIVTSELLHRPAIRTSEFVGCDQFARFVIRVRPESGSTANLADYGYVFRVRSKDAPSAYFDGYPLRATVVNGVGEFYVEVYDSAFGERPAIDMDVEVRATDRAKRLGPGSRFRLRADVPKQPDGV